MTIIIKITKPTNTPNLATGDVRVSWQIKKCGRHTVFDEMQFYTATLHPLGEPVRSNQNATFGRESGSEPRGAILRFKNALSVGQPTG